MSVYSAFDARITCTCSAESQFSCGPCLQWWTWNRMHTTSASLHQISSPHCKQSSWSAEVKDLLLDESMETCWTVSSCLLSGNHRCTRKAGCRQHSRLRHPFSTMYSSSGATVYAKAVSDSHLDDTRHTCRCCRSPLPAGRHDGIFQILQPQPGRRCCNSCQRRCYSLGSHTSHASGLLAVTHCAHEDLAVLYSRRLTPGAGVLVVQADGGFGGALGGAAVVSGRPRQQLGARRLDESREVLLPPKVACVASGTVSAGIPVSSCVHLKVCHTVSYCLDLLQNDCAGHPFRECRLRCGAPARWIS